MAYSQKIPYHKKPVVSKTSRPANMVKAKEDVNFRKERARNRRSYKRQRWAELCDEEAPSPTWRTWKARMDAFLEEPFRRDEILERFFRVLEPGVPVEGVDFDALEEELIVLALRRPPSQGSSRASSRLDSVVSSDSGLGNQRESPYGNNSDSSWTNSTQSSGYNGRRTFNVTPGPPRPRPRPANAAAVVNDVENGYAGVVRVEARRPAERGWSPWDDIWAPYNRHPWNPLQDQPFVPNADLNNNSLFSAAIAAPNPAPVGFRPVTPGSSPSTSGSSESDVESESSSESSTQSSDEENDETGINENKEDRLEL